MSVQPKAIFEDQALAKKSLQNREDNLVEAEVFLHVVSEGEEYLIPLGDISEIAENQPVKPYPLMSPGHFGIIHLRGNVIPVVSMNARNMKAIESINAKRIVVLRASDTEHVAVIATSIKKVTLQKDDFSLGETVTFNGRPVETMTARLILSQLEALS